jgi:hypothetical protein
MRLPAHPLRRIVIRLDVAPGPSSEKTAAHLLQVVIEDLRAQGADVRRAQVELRGETPITWR